MSERKRPESGVRLSGNVSHLTAAEFTRAMRREGLTLNEALQQAIMSWVYFRDEVHAGNRAAVVTPDDTVHRVAFTRDKPERT